jgi:hypothetical protein
MCTKVISSNPACFHLSANLPANPFLAPLLMQRTKVIIFVESVKFFQYFFPNFFTAHFAEE